VKKAAAAAAMIAFIMASCVSISEQKTPAAAGKSAAEKTPKIEIPDGPRGKTVKAAMTMLDKYYRYGGQGGYEGYDCSGLAQYAYAEAGIKIPRTVKRQYAEARRVDRPALKPGDLVFFTTYAAGATHVGIYAGKGYFIHSPTTGKKVDISSMENPYWKKAFVGAGTFFND